MNKCIMKYYKEDDLLIDARSGGVISMTNALPMLQPTTLQAPPRARTRKG